ncbi:ABC transporter ATP-binding protein [Streptococcus gallolyticus subsp. gallolyticus]|uniref:ABC transporter ATP-binding protein n=1 Tax=Streptococcus gallolyticus TaxID=315405 RepID=UPI0022833ADE|nr:ABC transporter ATP-binding protein [Streptococcus gallolyticus]MCY7172663.1 ABC transporter ATP-binding protein [Streptococcus gallolyticus subsp. gallolyticus]
MNSVELKNVVKEFSNIPVLDSINLTVKESHITCLLGPSGSGKTTIMKLMTGSEKPTKGQIILFGHQLSKKDIGQIGYMPQADAVYLDLSAYDNLVFFGQLYGMTKKEIKQRIDYLAELLDLESHLKQLVSTYSGGMKKRLSLAITLLNDPKLLILDEPTVGIDPILRQKIWREFRQLQKQGKTLLISTHVMDEVKYCDYGILIRDGKVIAADSMEILLEKSGSDVENLFLKEEGVTK